MTKREKCTWVFHSKSGAPTFKITKDDKSQNIMHKKYDLHYVEYNDVDAKTGIDPTSKVIYPHVNWADVKARLYDKN